MYWFILVTVMLQVAHFLTYPNVNLLHCASCQLLSGVESLNRIVQNNPPPCHYNYQSVPSTSTLWSVLCHPPPTSRSSLVSQTNTECLLFQSVDKDLFSLMFMTTRSAPLLRQSCLLSSQIFFLPEMKYKHDL